MNGLIWYAATPRSFRQMATSNEPGIYIRGEFGIHLEDDMHITENGAELFTPQSLSLEEPFGKRSEVEVGRDLQNQAPESAAVQNSAALISQP